MGLKNDAWIKLLAEKKQMIEPFVDHQITFVPRQAGSGDQRRIISYGLSSYGYDIRPAPEWKLFHNVHPMTVVDPKEKHDSAFVDLNDDVCVIPPNSFVLARTIEYFRIPRNVLVLCIGKSTYARCGLIVNITPLEPEWCGNITIEISNTTPLPARVYANEGIGQLLFFEGDSPPMLSYADRRGKYQGQTGVVPAKL